MYSELVRKVIHNAIISSPIAESIISGKDL